MGRLLRLIKKTALEAVDASKPAGLYFGTVTGISPLVISTEQKMPLGVKQLVLPQSMTDYTVAMSTDGQQRDYKVSGALKVGDRVALLREQGGQRYFVLDKVVGA